MMSNIEQASIASEWIRDAEALVVTAGAGMGVDSGLPDFRGTEGFWRAYPPYHAMKLGFENLATERLFSTDPTLAWGFYGHRLHLYRETIPHEGFAILRSWWNRCPFGGFVFTSNVDGQFQKAGFLQESLLERHGSIHHVQHVDYDSSVWPSDALEVKVDQATMRAVEPLPERDGKILRPNILMFDDYTWSQKRYLGQAMNYAAWLRKISRRALVVVELGAGLAIPTVRREGERLARAIGAKLIRINPRDPLGPPGSISLAIGALAGLRLIGDLV